MRYRLVVLGLATVLGVLPALSIVPAAPAPKKPKLPTIYALLYVGLSKNDLDNADRIDMALQFLLRGGIGETFLNTDIDTVPILKEQREKLGEEKRNNWVKSKLRAASVEGTAVVRVWFTAGSPEEQVAIINAIADTYVTWEQKRFKGALEALPRRKAFYIENVVKRPLNKEEERTFRRQEEAAKHLPHVIEWAKLSDKP